MYCGMVYLHTGREATNCATGGVKSELASVTIIILIYSLVSVGVHACHHYLISMAASVSLGTRLGIRLNRVKVDQWGC